MSVYFSKWKSESRAPIQPVRESRPYMQRSSAASTLYHKSSMIHSVEDTMRCFRSGDSFTVTVISAISAVTLCVAASILKSTP
ncbi:hypothetical protein N7457_006468 [Penicillium paradoxum]|uniref:uncharacterized protein n=1 Tax=Penicillium paradoxum TaxID=176176 RepID=UPI0025477E02|nr:uncharacterized protein N7457_006468 [Penicillium paradoxum]KAJ5781308.1 hypothetical protein N7457_006468 [Penicillium paradoxum]